MNALPLVVESILIATMSRLDLYIVAPSGMVWYGIVELNVPLDTV